jgi:hypothetical protein
VVALSADPAGADGDSRKIVIVIGPGRSGTSTVAGALCHSGLEVPGKAIRGNPTNPSGFYEPRWVVDFHRKLLKEQNVSSIDTMPGAQERIRQATTDPAVRETLGGWLEERLQEQPRLVVKDPRIVWFRDLWVDTARGLGVEPGFVTILRHPAEVAASRQKYYQSTGENDREVEIHRIAGWINVALTAEAASAGSPRTFVRYMDLISDWRTALSRIGSSLDLHYDPALDAPEHPVDGFIDSSLHRVQVDWNEVAVPEPLRDLGELVWQAMSRLASDGDVEEVRAEIATLRDDYQQMTDDALALVRPAIRRQTVAARRRGRRQLRDELEKSDQAQGVRGGGRQAASALWRRVAGGPR